MGAASADLRIAVADKLEPKIVLTDAPDPADTAVIADGLRAFNTSRAGYDDYRAWNAGKLICLTASNPPSPYIVGTHIYAVVGYDPTSSQPFKVFNPWGTNSSGWAPLTNNGRQVWGLFNANNTNTKVMTPKWST